MTTLAHSTRLKKFLMRHIALTFFLMGASFLCFGLVSLNLIYIFQANLNFLVENGWMAVQDGGLRQLVELLLSGYLGILFYVFFKVCEKVLVDCLCEEKS